MSDKKPNVLPTAEQMANANETGNMISEQLKNENVVQSADGSDAESQAAAQMKKNTDESLKMREENITKYEERESGRVVFQDRKVTSFETSEMN